MVSNKQIGIQNVHFPGFNYITGSEAHQFRECERIMRRVLESHGFEEIITPIVLPSNILLGGCIPISKSWWLFSFLTPWGEPAVLRLENTNAIARYIASCKDHILPARYYYICPMIRNETLESIKNEKERRFRQFIQCGWETVGYKNLEAVAETIIIGFKILKELELERSCRISETHLLEGIYKKINLSEEESDTIHLCFDKKDRNYLEYILNNNPKIDKKNGDTLLNMYDMNGSPDDIIPKAYKLLSDYSFSKKPLKKLSKMYSILKETGYGKYVLIDFSIARNLRLYNGLTLQYDIPGSPECGAAGECRKIIEKHGGDNIPLVGGGFGLERLILGIKKHEKSRSDIVVWSKSVQDALIQSEKLREQGYRVEIEITGRTLEQSLEFAKKQNARLYANGKFIS